MSALSPLQTLPLHAVEVIVDHVANNVCLELAHAEINIRSEACNKVQMPLLWVCRNFRAVVYSRFFKHYELNIDSDAVKAKGRALVLPRSLERVDYPFHLTAKEVTISIDPWAVFTGRALEALSHEPYSDCSFPLARMLEIKFNNGRYSKENITMLPDIEVNIGAFVHRIKQMAPKLNLAKLSGGLDPSEQAHVAYRQFGSLTTQLVQIVPRVELTYDASKAFPFLRVDVIRDLTYLHSNFDLSGEQTMQLIRRNAPTLQHLRIVSCVNANLSGIIQDANGGHVRYPHLHTLAVRLGMSWNIPQRYTFDDGAVPFPSLRRLDCRDDCPFGDNLALFRGNAATLELLKLALTHELALSLLRHKVFTPISHPKLQCVMLKLHSSVEPVSYTNGLEIIRLMLNIAPGAAVREVSFWSIEQAPPPLLSLFAKQDNLRVLALPDLRLSLWNAMTLIKSLPLLTDLHSKAPTLDPMPEGITKRSLVKYVTSNYSPMGTRFRGWHCENDSIIELKDAVKPFMLLALACPIFDNVAIFHIAREKFAEILEKAIDMATYREHAPRLLRLLPHVPE
ncbi:hypothetical protein H4S03_008353 [Coemansia sp. S3946]|nr:hypothetical protein H4S03_008353 [Coemansia sp. S3946]